MKFKGSARKKIQIGPKKKIAFVCSGGAAKAAAFHLGVALAMKEQGFQFRGGTRQNPSVKTSSPLEISTYVGSSAGSLICTFLAAGYTLDNIFNSYLSREPKYPEDRLPKVLTRLSYQELFKMRPELVKEQVGFLLNIKKTVTGFLQGDWESVMKLDWIKVNGLFSTRGLEKYLRNDVLPTNRFEELDPDLFIVATQLNHSRKVVFGKVQYEPPPEDITCQYECEIPISDAVAASTSLPPIFAPYPLKNKNGKSVSYIDGEIRDTLSTHVAVDHGADLVIASYTHQPYHFQKQVGSLTDYGLPLILIQSIYLMVEQKINAHVTNERQKSEALDSVSKYCTRVGISDAHRKGILKILETELHHRAGVDRIYIHPQVSDAEMFFGQHFNLSPKRMAEYVRCGFRSAIDVLSNYEFTSSKPAENEKKN